MSEKKLNLAVKLSQENAFIVKRIKTEQEAENIAELYQEYYKRPPLTKEMFLERWRFAQSHDCYYMLGVYKDSSKPLGFMDFSIVPSIFWAPCIARLDSLYIQEKAFESEILENLFAEVLSLMKPFKISKIIAVSCAKYEQEVKLLARKMQLDNDPSKTFFMLLQP